VWHNLAKAIRGVEQIYRAAFDPYRPELHYMRGPGPKCLAKNAARSAASPMDGLPAEAGA
jgi:hypothetical protein